MRRASALVKKHALRACAKMRGVDIRANKVQHSTSLNPSNIRSLRGNGGLTAAGDPLEHVQPDLPRELLATLLPALGVYIPVDQHQIRNHDTGFLRDFPSCGRRRRLS